MYPGVYEAKFGVTLRQVPWTLQGNIGYRTAKGVLIGGAAGAFAVNAIWRRLSHLRAPARPEHRWDLR